MRIKVSWWERDSHPSPQTRRTHTRHAQILYKPVSVKKLILLNMMWLEVSGSSTKWLQVGDTGRLWQQAQEKLPSSSTLHEQGGEAAAVTWAEMVLIITLWSLLTQRRQTHTHTHTLLLHVGLFSYDHHTHTHAVCVQRRWHRAQISTSQWAVVEISACGLSVCPRATMVLNLCFECVCVCVYVCVCVC